MAQDPNTFTIVVKTLTGKAIPFEVTAETTVDELKQMWYDVEAYMPRKFIAHKGNVRMEEHGSMGSYNLGAGDTLTVM